MSEETRAVLIGGPRHGMHLTLAQGPIVPVMVVWLERCECGEGTIQHKYLPVRRKDDGEWLFRWKRKP